MDYLSFCLEHLKGGQRCGKEWLFFCPNGCGEKLSVNIQTGQYRCFLCGLPGEKGGIQAAKDGVFLGTGNIKTLSVYFKEKTLPLPPENVSEEEPSTSDIRIALHKVLNPPESLKSHQEYLDKRGFSLDYCGFFNPLNATSSDVVLNRTSLLSSEEKNLLGLNEGNISSCFKRGKILIPYIHPKSGCILGVRSRSTLPSCKIRYLWVRGTRANKLVYSLKDISQEERVMLTEGEIKSALPTLLGIPSYGIPGINASHKAFLEVICRSKTQEVIICFDSERKERTERNVKASINKISNFLKDVEIRVGEIILPLQDGEDKIGVDDFIFQNGISILKTIFYNTECQ